MLGCFKAGREAGMYKLLLLRENYCLVSMFYEGRRLQGQSMKIFSLHIDHGGQTSTDQ